MLKVIRENGHWHVRGTFMGERVRRTTGLRATQQFKPNAERVRVQVERDIANNSFGNKRVHETFEDAAVEYMRWKKIEKRLDKRTESKINMFCEYWGNMPLPEIHNGMVASYITSHWTHLGPSSVKRYLNDFIAILNHADKRLTGFTAPKISRPFVDDVRTVHLEAEEATAVTDWMRKNREVFYPHFATMIDTGVRMKELVAIGPRCFSHNKQVTMIRKSHDSARTKTNARDVPMSEAMSEIAQATQGLPAHIPVYQGVNGPWENPASASAALNIELKAACKELGLPYKGTEAVRCHDLRHTFAYLCASNGADLGDIQYLMGHSDISQTMRYRGFVQSRARNCVNGMRAKSAVK
jgi:integrase